MTLTVRKKIKENSQSLIQRFSQKVKRSGVLIEVRKRQSKKKKTSRQLKKRLALRRLRKKDEYEKTKKLGRR